MFKGIRTVTELGKCPEGQSAEQHIRAVRAAMEEHARRAMLILQEAEEAGRASNLLADEQRNFDRFSNESRLLENLLARLEWGESIDWSQVSHAGPDSEAQRRAEADFDDWAPTKWAGHDPLAGPRGYDRQARVGWERLTYRPDDTRTSWVRDLRSMVDGVSGEQAAARERLARNAREVASVEKRALTSYTPGAASELVPPAWALDLIATVSRPARITADQIQGAPLPPNAMTINVPRITSGTSVAAQASENTAVSDTNAGTDMISSSVHTLAGKQVLSFQIVDQSPVNVDQLIIQDLAAELAKQVDAFVLTSNATGKTGILSMPDAHVVSYTDTTPTPQELYAKIADGIQRVSTTRYLPPDKIIMHPRRWSWFLAALDNNGRPLVTPEANHPQNAMAAQGSVVAQGFAGTLQGLPVFLDSVIPTNSGTGTNEDTIIIMRSPDLLLWESGPRIVADRVSLAGQLSLQVVLWEYCAVQMRRYPQSVARVSGTGLATPAF